MNKAKRHFLRNLRVQWLSAVPEGANPGAEVMLIKEREREDNAGALRPIIEAAFAGPMAKEDKPQSFDQALQNEEIRRQWWALQDALRESVVSIINSDNPDKGALLRETIGQFVTRLTGIMAAAQTAGVELSGAKAPTLELAEVADEVEKAGRVLSEANIKRVRAALAIIQDLLDAGAPPEPKQASVKAGEATVAVKIEDVLAKVTPEEQALLKEHFAKDTAPKVEVDVLKGLSPEQRDLVEKAQKQAAEAIDRSTKLEKAMAEREAQVRKDALVTKAGREYQDLGGAFWGELLHRAHEADPALGKDLETKFDALAAQAKTAALFTVTGKPGAARAGSAQEELDKLAKERATADKITFAKATALIVAERGDLYTRIQEEKAK